MFLCLNSLSHAYVEFSALVFRRRENIKNLCNLSNPASPLQNLQMPFIGSCRELYVKGFKVKACPQNIPQEHQHLKSARKKERRAAKKTKNPTTCHRKNPTKKKSYLKNTTKNKSKAPLKIS